ncbi:DUF5320 domain-containing protein [Geoalkalibacter ferrihydriticus]|uniref:DUF5320 domain-containing protein n=1 Tax=Geoalkalibacter ferrihydriticus TaxID=392333 RepID=UPI0013791B7B
MPGRNGTGPLGQGSASGRGWGVCSGREAETEAWRSGGNRFLGRGLGQGRRLNCRRGVEGAGLRNEIARLGKILTGLKGRQDQNS